MKHKLTLSDEELDVLEERLTYVKPVDYTLENYALLRGLYGRIVHLRYRRPFPISTPLIPPKS